ncbi:MULTISPECIES: methylamine utilization protein [unclassified Duganella]|uniref:methylamine utilization protein n=1 Tax=unclassified Duganella TaxID=2636909 RepID=UPI000E355F66|nr:MULTISPECIES: methylamine utilization protein [unclassified Duganella]RFP13587.1 methylamine utilization protein [Duganella sp. BJB475]RFP36295.1 methylamine utilization protein [Duganella sp. BJB476]
MHRHALRQTLSTLLLLSTASAGATGVTVQVQDAGGKALADTVVYVEPESGTASGRAPATAEIEQKGLKFAPLVSVVQTGAKIFFPNNDKVRHHIYSFSPAHKFDQKLYSGQSASPQVFDKAGTVVLGCNIHDKMLAYVKVVDTPYFAKTDAAGAARIELPAGGKYVVKAWHYNTVGGATPEQVVTVKAGDAPASVTFKLPMKPIVADDPSSTTL